jgi:hypothetical protein
VATRLPALASPVTLVILAGLAIGFPSLRRVRAEQALEMA